MFCLSRFQPIVDVRVGLWNVGQLLDCRHSLGPPPTGRSWKEGLINRRYRGRRPDLATAASSFFRPMQSEVVGVRVVAYDQAERASDSGPRPANVGNRPEFVNEQLADTVGKTYPHRMCRNITRDQQIEGWRATVELLRVFRPKLVGVMAAALVTWLHRGIFAVGGRRT